MGNDFRAALAEGIEAAQGDQSGAPRSPILEAVHQLSVAEFTPTVAPDAQLFIVSDMLQHSVDFSHYSKPFPVGDEVDEFMSDFLPNLRGVSVTVLLINRRGPDRERAKKAMGFWGDVFERAGVGSQARFIRVR